jgi:hypothetical protein
MEKTAKSNLSAVPELSERNGELRRWHPFYDRVYWSDELKAWTSDYTIRDGKSVRVRLVQSGTTKKPRNGKIIAKNIRTPEHKISCDKGKI